MHGRHHGAQGYWVTRGVTMPWTRRSNGRRGPGPTGENFIYAFKPALAGRTGGVAAVRLLPPARQPARARPPKLWPSR